MQRDIARTELTDSTSPGLPGQSSSRPPTVNWPRVINTGLGELPHHPSIMPTARSARNVSRNFAMLMHGYWDLRCIEGTPGEVQFQRILLTMVLGGLSGQNHTSNATELRSIIPDSLFLTKLLAQSNDYYQLCTCGKTIRDYSIVEYSGFFFYGDEWLTSDCLWLVACEIRPDVVRGRRTKWQRKKDKAACVQANWELICYGFWKNKVYICSEIFQKQKIERKNSGANLATANGEIADDVAFVETDKLVVQPRVPLARDHKEGEDNRIVSRNVDHKTIADSAPRPGNLSYVLSQDTEGLCRDWTRTYDSC
ncbi:hypothetical protein WN48_10454 [Eufriesea mexicana]|uniref:Uncharacterized protein n=1 Tax=Eufriesea mexicana TaxID=516756 RepID=A0A310S9U6_9HYME|nr:hypothetical protein WN48_10454 [Eufriesea mexicana]